MRSQPNPFTLCERARDLQWNHTGLVALQGIPSVLTPGYTAGLNLCCKLQQHEVCGRGNASRDKGGAQSRIILQKLQDAAVWQREQARTVQSFQLICPIVCVFSDCILGSFGWENVKSPLPCSTVSSHAVLEWELQFKLNSGFICYLEMIFIWKIWEHKSWRILIFKVIPSKKLTRNNS